MASITSADTKVLFFYLNEDKKHLEVYEKLKNNSKRLTDIISFNISEFSIFKALLLSKNTPVSRDELILTGWSDKIVTTTSLNVAIMNIRNKIVKFSTYFSIKTVQSKGYKLYIESHESFEESIPLVNYEENNYTSINNKDIILILLSLTLIYFIFSL
ncbi:helix-turn-helix domain-containing protein [Aliivibrio logei]|uniref:OmpR/PhoB-type domain-containing protein n=1 Tax=Aliivibrio logei 5S-186 TaxID=626086 RepID=A0ABX3ATH1_ALILO|nr:helix-turn-helix domain-containing protein [Aliivibrio logei]OEF11835.1 hypothetical protein A1Q5_09840 [Aliivibrio logei 5S-186]